MNELLKVIFSLSLSGSLLILILFACRPLYRERFSKRWQYYVWLIVLMRFIIPFTPETSLMGSLFPKIESAMAGEMTAIPENVPAADGGELYPDLPPGFPSRQTDEPASDNSAAPPAQSGSPVSPQDFLWLTWPVIALVLMVHKITAYRSFEHYVTAGNVEVSDPAILNLLSDLCEQAGVKTRVELSTNPLIASPVLMGFFRPHIVLPDTGRDEAELRYILLHELTHCRRRDIYYKWLIQTVLCVHWFNPLIYLAAREINKACELACDEAVIRNLDADGKKAYGSTLLAAVGAPQKYKQSVAAVTFSENATELKERLESIMKFRGKSKWSVAAAMCSVLLIAAGTMTGAYASSLDPIQKPITAVIDETATRQLPVTAANYHTVSATKTTDQTDTATIKPNITGGSVVLEETEKITALDIRPSIGNLTIKRGGQYKIEVGSRLVDHAIYEIRDGVLKYFDDYARENINGNNPKKDFDITITVPGDGIIYDNVTVYNEFGSVNINDIDAIAANIGSAFGEGEISGVKAGTLDAHFDFGSVTIKNCSVSGAVDCGSEFGGLTLEGIQAKSLAINAQSGGVDIKGCTIDGAVTCEGEMGGYTIHGLKASSLAINNEMGGIKMLQSTISNGLNIVLGSGGAEISGDFKGDISIDQGMGGLSLNLTGSKRSDYHIIAGSGDSGENSMLSAGIDIDGKTYPYDYEDTNTNAPYTMTISSSNVVGDVSIRFAGE